MVIKLVNGVFVTQDMKDCLELVEPELAEAIRYYHEHGEEGLKDKYDNLKSEFESYESSNESYRNCLLEVGWVAEQLIKDVEDNKKINKENLLEKLNYIVNSINFEL